MPTYEYRCEACGHGFEAFQQMSDEPLDACPSCGGPVRRLPGAGAGFLMKGRTPSSSASVPCGRGQTCCGRETRCDKPACGE